MGLPAIFLNVSARHAAARRQPRHDFRNNTQNITRRTSNKGSYRPKMNWVCLVIMRQVLLERDITIAINYSIHS